MENHKQWYKAETKDKQDIADFLVSMNNQTQSPLTSLPGGIEGLLNLAEKNGGFLYTKEDNKIIGISQYTYGEPSKNYKNKEIGYLYLTVINPNNRRDGRRSLNLFKKYIEVFEESNSEKIKWKSYKENNQYVNRLYSKFATITKESINTQNIVSYEWTTTVDKLKNKFRL